MRTRLGALALGIGLGLAASAAAQVQTVNVWNGAMPRQIHFQPVDTTKALKQFDASKYFHTPTPPQPTTLSNVFHAFNPLNLWNWGSPARTAAGQISSAPALPQQ
jgi:hypothetical protein